VREWFHRSIHVEQAIVDAHGDAMLRGKCGATAGDLVAAVLRSSALSARVPIDVRFDVPFARTIECADQAAQARGHITDLADVLQCLLDECAGALASSPAARATLEDALAEARLRPRFATNRDEVRATFWRVETTRASGGVKNQYFTTRAQAKREHAGLPMTGQGIQVTADCYVEGEENDPVVGKRVVSPGSE
jgi:hypothetical protein